MTDGAGHERHVALFHATWYAGARELYHQVTLFVRRMSRVPAVS